MPDMDDINDENLYNERNDIVLNDGLYSPLSSSESVKISLETIRNKKAGLNKHREALLSRIPNQNDWGRFSLNSISNKDLAYLSAATGDEFALMRGKSVDILYHGTKEHCAIDEDELLMELLCSHKIYLECHTHPDYDFITPSVQDRNFLNYIGQKKSKIISSITGNEIEFSANRFEDL